MLIGSFFTILYAEEKQADTSTPVSKTYIARIRINPEHEIFRGHFPGNPVVPGVCQVQMIRETLEFITGYQGVLLDADNIKFLSMIVPDEKVELELDIKTTGSDPTSTGITATLRSPESTHLKFKGTLCLKPR
jgi:3-hydroxyacyl-[acyl-carrier-protein] dehydratase